MRVPRPAVVDADEDDYPVGRVRHDIMADAARHMEDCVAALARVDQFEAMQARIVSDQPLQRA